MSGIARRYRREKQKRVRRAVVERERVVRMDIEDRMLPVEDVNYASLFRNKRIVGRKL